MSTRSSEVPHVTAHQSLHTNSTMNTRCNCGRVSSTAVLLLLLRTLAASCMPFRLSDAVKFVLTVRAMNVV